MKGSRKIPPAETDKTTKGNYFENLEKHSTNLLESFGTIKETFNKAMQTPIYKIYRRYEQIQVHGKHMKVVPWPGETPNRTAMVRSAKHGLRTLSASARLHEYPSKARNVSATACWATRVRALHV